jgi:hypothetical protein
VASRLQAQRQSNSLPIPLLRYFPQFLLRFCLQMAAPRIAKTKPLHCVPGWWSGGALEAPPEEERQLRRAVWQALAEEHVRVDWYDGLRLELRMNTDLGRLLFIAGEIDPNEFWFLSRFLKPGMFIIDVGANEGLYSLFCRRRVDCSSEASGHAFRLPRPSGELGRARPSP